MKYALATAIIIALCGPAAAKHPHHARHHHHRNHHRHVVVAGNFAEGLGHGLAHMLDSIKTVQTDAGAIRVSGEYAERFRGFINALVAAGYKPHEIGCYARGGHMPHSKHYRGLACDIDQRRRNVTAPRMYHVTELAHRFHLEDGCEWRRPDCGHIQVPSVAHVTHRRTHYAKR